MLNPLANPDVDTLGPEAYLQLKALVRAAQGPTAIVVNPGIGLARIHGVLNVEPGVPTDLAMRFLQDQAVLLGADSATLEPVHVDDVGNTKALRVCVRQTAAGVPVLGAGWAVDVVSSDEDQRYQIVAVAGRASRAALVDPTPTVSAEKAAAVMAEHLQFPDGAASPEVELVVFDPETVLGEAGEVHLAWFAALDAGEKARVVVISALDRTVLLDAEGPGGAAGPCRGLIRPDAPLPRFAVNDRTGVPSFVSFGREGLWLPETLSGDPEEVALAFFERHPTVFGTFEPHNQLRVDHIESDEAPPHMTHVALQQVYGGIPVYGAVLRVHLSPSLTITSISGNYVPWPAVVPTVENLDAAAARKSAESHLVDVRRKLGKDALIEPDGAPLEDAADALVVLSQALAGPATPNTVAWQFRAPEADVFVSARTGDLALLAPNQCPARRIVHDASSGSAVTVLEDGNTRPGAPATRSEHLELDRFINAVLGFWSHLGRDSFDGSGAAVEGVANFMFASPNAVWLRSRRQALFSPGWAVSDVVSHEVTHGVINETARLVFLDESGAVNEHYADVFGNLAFPDANGAGNWLVGEDVPASDRNFAPSLRNMKTSTPAIYGEFQSRGNGCGGVRDVLSPTCDAGRVHTNSSIGNRAAVLLSDGDGTAAHTGIGRARLAKAFAETLCRRMHPWANYLDEALNTWQSASDLALRAIVATDPANPATRLPFDQRVLDEVAWAFSAVGIDRRLLAGWHRVPGGSTPARLVFNPGERLPAGSTVQDVELIVAVTDTDPIWTGRASGSNATVRFPGDIFSLAVVESALSPAVADDSAQVTVAVTRQGTGDFHVQAALTPTLTLSPERRLPTPTFIHEQFLTGASGRDAVAGALLPEGATITRVVAELLDDRGSVVHTVGRGEPERAVPTGPFGWLSWAVRLDDAQMGRNPAATVSWRFDTSAVVRYRLVYFVTAPDWLAVRLNGIRADRLP